MPKHLLSSQAQLKARGQIETQDLLLLQNKSNSQLLELLNSQLPWERTAAVLSLQNRISEAELSIRLLECLSTENKLYTKLAICKVLQEGTVISAKLMLPYLGKIGHNQHRKPDEKKFKKKSYPLSRDIIARTLSKFQPENLTQILPVLFDFLVSGQAEQVSELIDAIGFLLFYNPEYLNEENLQKLKDTELKYKNNQLIAWKFQHFRQKIQSKTIKF